MSDSRENGETASLEAELQKSTLNCQQIKDKEKAEEYKEQGNQAFKG